MKDLTNFSLYVNPLENRKKGEKKVKIPKVDNIISPTPVLVF